MVFGMYVHVCSFSWGRTNLFVHFGSSSQSFRKTNKKIIKKNFQNTNWGTYTFSVMMKVASSIIVFNHNLNLMIGCY